MNPEQKLELGIEIVAAMKASISSNPDIEAGRIDALENTEVDRFEVFTYEEFCELPKERQEHLKGVAKRCKEHLHKQALYVADVVTQKYELLNQSSTTVKDRPFSENDLVFKAKRIDTGGWVTGFFTKKKIGSLIVPVIEVYKEWDTGDYMESYQIDGDTLTKAN